MEPKGRMIEPNVGVNGRMFEIVCTEIGRLDIPELDARRLRCEMLLIEDIGLDSLKFVDLTVGLEDALGIEEFPMQEWVDEQMIAGAPLTVGALVAACHRMVEKAG